MQASHSAACVGVGWTAPTDGCQRGAKATRPARMRRAPDAHLFFERYRFTYDNILFKTKELHIIIKSHDVSGTVPLSINIIFELLMVKTTNV